MTAFTARSSFSRPPACGAAKCSDSGGATSTSTTNKLAVVQTLTTVRWEPRITQPKTQRSRRTIYLDAQTVTTLRAHRRRQREEQLAAGEAWTKAYDLVFRDELGRPLHPEWFSREFQLLVRQRGTATNSTTRPATHFGDAGTGGGSPSQSRLRTTRPCHSRNHARPVLPRHTGHRPRRGRCNRRQDLHAGETPFNPRPLGTQRLTSSRCR